MGNTCFGKYNKDVKIVNMVSSLQFPHNLYHQQNSEKFSVPFSESIKIFNINNKLKDKTKNRITSPSSLMLYPNEPSIRQIQPTTSMFVLICLTIIKKIF